MTISKELFLAILSMDAYNRGYGAGISDGYGETGANGEDIDGLGRNGSKIGAATVTNDANSTAAQAAGFYAIAYTLTEAVGEGAGRLEAGTTVISYRGTDFSPNPGLRQVNVDFQGTLPHHPFHERLRMMY